MQDQATLQTGDLLAIYNSFKADGLPFSGSLTDPPCHHVKVTLAWRAKTAPDSHVTDAFHFAFKSPYHSKSTTMINSHPRHTLTYSN